MYLFEGCDLLDTLELPDSVTIIGRCEFGKSGLTCHTGSDCTIFGSLLIRHETVLYRFVSPSELTIPSNVRETGEVGLRTYLATHP
jgi:hypothetical protein